MTRSWKAPRAAATVAFNKYRFIEVKHFRAFGIILNIGQEEAEGDETTITRVAG